MHPSHTAFMLGFGASMLVALFLWLWLRGYLVRKSAMELVNMLVACQQVELPPQGTSSIDELGQASIDALHRAKRKLDQMALQGACSHQRGFMAYQQIENAWHEALCDAIWEHSRLGDAQAAVFYHRMWASDIDRCLQRLLPQCSEALRTAWEATLMDEGSEEDPFDNRVPFAKIEQAVRELQHRGGQVAVACQSEGQFGWLVLRAA